jgi:hypothetical protein
VVVERRRLEAVDVERVAEVDAQEQRAEEHVHPEHAGERARFPGAEIVASHHVGDGGPAGLALEAVEHAAEVERGDALEVVEDEQANERIERELQLGVHHVIVLADEELGVERVEAAQVVGRGEPEVLLPDAALLVEREGRAARRPEHEVRAAEELPELLRVDAEEAVERAAVGEEPASELEEQRAARQRAGVLVVADGVVAVAERRRDLEVHATVAILPVGGALVGTAGDRDPLAEQRHRAGEVGEAVALDAAERELRLDAAEAVEWVAQRADNAKVALVIGEVRVERIEVLLHEVEPAQDPGEPPRAVLVEQHSLGQGERLVDGEVRVEDVVPEHVREDHRRPARHRAARAAAVDEPASGRQLRSESAS